MKATSNGHDTLSQNLSHQGAETTHTGQPPIVRRARVMPLFVKIIPLWAGTSEPADEPRLLRCPPDVEPDTIFSFLAQRLGAPVETVWTFTERHERLGIGWVFPAASAIGP
jgi:hypothetical protein